MINVRFARLLLAASAIGLAGCASAQPAPIGSVRIAGPDEVVLPASSFGKCAIHRGNQDAPDVPDAPLRMVRRADGKIMAIAADTGTFLGSRKTGRLSRGPAAPQSCRPS